jgi:predicted dehydrogenase
MSANRRHFLQAAGAGTVALTLGTNTARADVAGKVTLGIIGPGGMGSNHVDYLCGRDDVSIARVCDVDNDRCGSAADKVYQSTNQRPQQSTDMREVLDDPSIDAVFIATPDHWHAPASLLALAAGKHVYVEKPCCHNVREGRLMVDAVERTGLVLQVGTQTRSTEFVMEAMQRIHEGEIGDILVAKAWNSQRRSSIGKTGPSDPPENLDFDTWLGPAPVVPYRTNLLHGVWRWWHDFGCGDMGNDGVHDIDVALWGLGVTGHPDRAVCFGRKLFFDDDQQFPDTQYAIYEYPADEKGRKRQMIFEQRDWSPYTQEGYENGAAFYGTEGVLICGHTVGWRLYGPRMELKGERTGQADLAAHHQNFLDSIRGEATPNADVNAGHRAATIVHLGNIGARLGGDMQFDPVAEQITNHPEANALLTRQYRDHWGTPAV